jgi:hypothetical protein
VALAPLVRGSEGEEFISSFSFSFSVYFWCNLISIHGHGVAYWLKHCATIRKVLGSIAGGVTGDFFRCMRQFHTPGVDSASKNEYHEAPGSKDGR